jgi:hypothetical protein
MIRSTLKLVLLCLLFAAVHAEERSWPSRDGLFLLSYASELRPLQINKLHAWTLHIEDAQGNPVVGANLQVSGGMPAHNHGLPTNPRITAELGNGDYRLDGMRFHMSGAWEITINIAADGDTDSVVVLVDL